MRIRFYPKNSMIQVFLAFFLSFALCLSASSEDELDTNLLNNDNIYTFLRPARVSNYMGWIKFTLFVDQNGTWKELKFQNTNLNAFHVDYLRQFPDFKNLTPSRFLEMTMKKKNRRALLGTLLILPDKDGSIGSSQYQLLSNDELTLQEVLQIQKLISQASSSVLKSFSYFPSPEQRGFVLKKITEYKAAGVDAIFPAPPGSNACYHSGWTVGQVRLLSNTEFEDQHKKGLLTPQDILILEKTPREIPSVAAIITSQFTAPSSQMTTLAQVFGFPFVYEKDAYSSEKWKQRNGQFLFLSAAGDINFCRMNVRDEKDLTQDEMRKLVDIKSPKISNQPRLDTSQKGLVVLSASGNPNGNGIEVSKIGGEAYAFARMAKIIPQNGPQGAVAIPVSYYTKYLESAKMLDGTVLKSFIQSKLKNISDANTPLSKIVNEMKNIREGMESTAIPDALITELQIALAKQFKNPKLRLELRSSSNAEDIPEFSTAGLYDSEGICPADEGAANDAKSKCRNEDKADPFSNGLNKVWRSLFTDRAYLARRWFGIDESKVAMAVLVNPSIQNELANGVAVFSAAGRGFTELFTGFPGGELEVSRPPDGKFPETARLMAWDPETDPLVEISVASSEVDAGKTLLPESEYLSFFRLMRSVFHKWLGEGEPSSELSLDFEWKVIADSAGKRTPILKQVRKMPKPAQVMKGGKNLTLVGTRSLRLQVMAGENDNGLRALLGNMNLDFKIGTFTFPDSKTTTLPVEQATLYGVYGNYNLKSDDLKNEARAGNWESSQDWTGRNITKRTWQVQINLPNPEIQSLKLSFSVDETKAQKQTFLDNPVQEFRTMDFALTANPRDVVVWKKAPEEELPNPSAFWLMRDQVELQEDEVGTKQEVNQTWANPKLAFSVKASWQCPSMICKTAFYDLEKIEITGLTSPPLVFTSKKSMVYAPAHHNFSWEYAVDLFQADKISEAQKKEVLAAGGRYFTFGVKNEAELSAYLWNENGDKKKLGNLTIKPN